MAGETDEISLVDLVKSIIRRRVLFFATFGLIVVVGVAVAFLKPKTHTDSYTYTALYALASSNMGKPLQNPAAVLAMIQTVYVPEQVERYTKASGKGDLPLPFKITASNPASTALIVLKARSNISHSAAVKAIQNATLRQLETDDDQVLLERKKELTAQVDSLRMQLEVLRGHSGNSVAIASVLQNLTDARQRLLSLTHGRMIALAKRSIEPTNIHATHRALVVVIAFVVGVLIALLAVFVAELAAAVKTSSS